MNDLQTKETLLLIESGRVYWTVVGTQLRFHTGTTFEGDYQEADEVGKLSDHYWRRDGFEKGQSGSVSLTPAGEDLLRELDGRPPKKSVWGSS